MTAAHRHSDLHDLVDQLSPAQADAVRAVVVQLVAHEATRGGAEASPRRPSFVGAGASEHGISPRIDGLLAVGFGRD